MSSPGLDPTNVPTTIDGLRTVAARCTACDLYERATQTVFGEGPADARAVFIGEQPGDQEDQAGRPFVGPAGRVLDDACQDAGIDRNEVYVTNAVKHFKWTPRGKRRLHQKPNGREIRACQPWWKAELEVVEPEVVVCLGAVAAQALLGASFRVTKDHGRWQRLDGRDVLATVHPSAVLRAGDARDEVYAGLVGDLRVVSEFLGRES